MTAITQTYPTTELDFGRRVSWAAIFGGTLVALATELVFIAFGFFIGFQYSRPGPITLWTEIWYFVTAFCALFFGGWTTARLSVNTSASGLLQATVTWGLTTMVTFAFTLWILGTLLNTSLMAIQTATHATNTAAATSSSPVVQSDANAVQRGTASGVNQVEQQAPYLGNVLAAEASDLALILFGGILCGCAGAMIGGSAGRAGFGRRNRTGTVEVRDTGTSTRAASA